ncbi:ABC transporter ATP-binding protein [Fuchsiella alkaliacetigena]|uniref:ABC transporter ATP-binding protein n=1 Tax=Fuchsiella alkaliacetigena TaxID=957042 RepID=UPI00200B53CC|nr:ABC transporter ATP-binding protein [Fuchsiella alkaliacetigena]MCK8823693.1 ABC transporter ATP-binding protein [Fuchsiella alkaliacetigena]
MIEVKDLRIDLGSFVVEDISLTVEEGTCHVIIGPTGSGKTLILESMIGFREFDTGAVFVDDKEISELPVEKRGVSYVPQDLAIFPHLTVKENIMYSLNVNKIKEQKRYQFVMELADKLGITHLLNRAAKNLSGGEEQRVALVRALAVGNNFLLLDEPFSALHEGMKKDLWLLLKEIQAEYNLTILMITHDLEEAFFLGDQLSLMINGKIHQSGNKKCIYQRPATIEVANFFGIKNLFSTRVLEVQSKKLIVESDELATKLELPYLEKDKNKLTRENKVQVGIRAEEVMILKNKSERPDRDNLLTGEVINIFEKGAYNTVLVEPRDSKQQIEVSIPNHAFQQLEIERDKQVIVSLKSKSLFYILD